MSKQSLTATIVIILVVLATAYYSFGLSKKPQINLTTVKQANITQGVSVDGQVQSSQDLSLAFQQGGVVSEIDVTAGQQVKKGQVLVKLDTRTISAAVSQASAAVASAQANNEKVLNGATNANVSVSQAAVDSAQTTLTNAQKNQLQTTAQQALLVKNAQSTLFNSNLTATPATSNTSTVVPSVTGAYTGTTPGQYQIKVYSTGSGLHFTATGLENFDGIASTAPVPLGTMGLFIQFPAGTIYPNDVWTINLPNTQGSSYLTNNNAYQTALQNQSQATVTAQATVDTAQAQLDQAKANLQLVQTPARPEDIDAAKAQVQAAQANLQSAEANLSNSILTAPIDGIVGSVDTKVGQTVSGSSIAPGPDVVKMISNEKFQIVVYLSETNVGKIKTGDTANITLSAYGSGVNFPASVISIEPSATTQNGISAYKTTLQFNSEDDRIKEGMDANVVITDQTHQNVLVIPQSAIITKNNLDYVLTSVNGKITQTQIQTGITGVDGNVEVTSGLSAGQSIAAIGGATN